MADIALSAVGNVKPLVESIRKPVQVGEIVDVGEIVYLKTDGKYWLADAAALLTTQARGIVVAIGAYGATSSVADQMVDICVFGPVGGWTGLTPGENLYSSVTAGAIADAVPIATNFVWVLGYAHDAETIFVNPYTYDIVVLS